MRHRGWAFGLKDGDMPSGEISARFEELRHRVPDYGVWIKKAPNHAHTRFSGELPDGVELSDLDILILADDGNLCFGGECTLRGRSFSGSYNTD